MTNGWPFDGWVIVVAMDNGTGCTGYNGMPRLVFKLAIKISLFYWSRKGTFENHKSDNQHGDTCFDSWYSGCREPGTNESASKNLRNEIAVSDGAI